MNFSGSSPRICTVKELAHDQPCKAAGLAKYAAEHGHKFNRIVLIIVDGEHVKKLDLTDEVVRDKVKAVKEHAHVRQFFENETEVLDLLAYLLSRGDPNHPMFRK